MAKRKLDSVDELEFDDRSSRPKVIINPPAEKVEKHTLDSDEEDSGDDEQYNILDENDIEGEEDGNVGLDGDVKITPFNMKEELEEGHFDKEGHYQWDKSKDIRDNWLDNIDWIKIRKDPNKLAKAGDKATGDDSSSDSDSDSKAGLDIDFDLGASYRKIFEYLKPGETVKKAIQRIGGGKNKKLSSTERWKRKKAGLLDESNIEQETVMKLTELANELLTRTGNMDIYEETYEMIKRKIKPTKTGDDMDMYADDFDEKEKQRLETGESSATSVADEAAAAANVDNPILQWEFKWKEEDTNIHGPFGTQQMQLWVDEGYFKGGVYVRKVGEQENFFSSHRIDFELYL